MALVNLKLCAEALRKKFKSPSNLSIVVDTDRYSFGEASNLAVALQIGNQIFPLNDDVNPDVIDGRARISDLPLRDVLLAQQEDFLTKFLASAINAALVNYQLDVQIGD